jgi:hypothetical protein
MTKINKKLSELLCVGFVSDECGKFYILRDFEVSHFREDCHRHHFFTGMNVNVPEVAKIYGSFIVNNTTYYYAKVPYDVVLKQRPSVERKRGRKKQVVVST